MKILNLMYENGKTFPVYVVRYFRYKTNLYLIYTLQEKDERNYMKLYVVKVMEELDEKVSQTVRKSDEWTLMKGIVKNILSQIKKGNLTCIEDLDVSELEGMIIYESKNFSIASDLAELLATNKEEISSTLLTEEDIENDNQGNTETLELESEDEDIEILELDFDLSDDTSSEEIEVLEL